MKDRHHHPEAEAARSNQARVASATAPSDPPTQRRPGLRERKKQRMLADIQRTAIKLFAKQGYEETTIEQIADAADVSASTIFRYFPNKEDLILSDEYDALILASITAGPPDEPPVAALRRALAETYAPTLQQDSSMFLTRGKLMLGVPELRARLWDFLQQNETLLCQVFARQSGRDPDDFELRVAAGAIIGAIMTALTEWIESEGKADMMQLLDRALYQLEVGLGRLKSPTE